jgi:methylthioxylose transferase
LAATRDRRLWALLGGAVLAMVVADVSDLSDGEVERIWLPFAIWLLPAGAALAGRDRTARLWLAVQAACPLVVLVYIRPLW